MKKGELFQMIDLTPIQKEIVTALEQMKEKSLITEANLAKKVRENAKKSAVSLVKKSISVLTNGESIVQLGVVQVAGRRFSLHKKNMI